ncbi:restriction endonuclease subunit S [Helicobacter pylori]|uniref:restriction endonuclease subunit S n=1 Tax=Helicobacter pylori TaxID=210 RepID=UPI000FDE9C99|nr:restriction endonuclease subunit S [Helicobacter pylori]RVY36925.1 restriction endonuclease subunit S [Helicobacter pylori]RVY86189.1 restriction endonuclease subunit S [Helicobacter pylori]
MDALTTPSNWQRVRLGDILSYEQPTKYLVATTQYLQKGFTPILTAGKTFILGYTNDKHGIYTNIPVIIFDDFTTDSKMVNFPFKVKSSAIKILSLRDNNQADLKYIYEKLTLLKHQVTDHKRYWIDEFSNFEIPLPPLNEQIAIANILSDLDHYLCSLDALILKKESVKKALSFELLSQRKRLKGFNQAWQRVRLGDIAEIKRGVRITKNELDVFGKYPVVSGGVGFLGYTNNFNRYENTITIAQYGTAGYVNFQKNKFWANDVCFCVYPNKDVIKNIFLYYFLKVNQNYLYEISNRNATPYSISKDKILDFEILLPPLNEQIAIANILSALDHEIASLKNKKRQFENIKKALNHDLMSAKIRVLKK